MITIENNNEVCIIKNGELEWAFDYEDDIEDVSWIISSLLTSVNIQHEHRDL